MDPEATNQLPTWLRWLILIAVILTFGGVAFLLHERRRLALERLAEELGLTHHEHGGTGVALPPTHALQTSRGDWEARWMIQGRIGRFAVTVAELRCVTDPAKGSTRGYPVTLVVLDPLGDEIPDFLLRPETMGQRIAAAVSGQDIDFPDSTRFSRRFRLTGNVQNDEHAIRELFTPDVRAHFERHPGRITQVIDGRLYHWQPPKMLRFLGFQLRKIRTLIREGVEVGERLTSK
ncbi:hypothetical protein JXA47_06295 [Candidatus Sumerlaeota bacterium]|nr:hypothetical protein [Candidatus Sumerlaeota bacterium]